MTEEMHWHHVLPRYRGGTDDPGNLVYITRSQHAEEHRKLFEKHGDTRDLWAWKMLEKTMTYEDRSRIMSAHRQKWVAENPEKAVASAAHARSFITDEVRAKIGLSKRGSAPWNKGIKTGQNNGRSKPVQVTERASGVTTQFRNVSEAKKLYPGINRILNKQRTGRLYSACYVGG